MPKGIYKRKPRFKDIFERKTKKKNKKISTLTTREKLIHLMGTFNVSQQKTKQVLEIYDLLD